MKRAPPSGESPTATRAPWWRTCWATSASPRPEPGAARVPRGARTARRSARGRLAGRPAPSSSTWSTGPPSVERAPDRPSRRRGAAAFSSRLSTRSRSPGSQPRTRTGVVGQVGLDRAPGWRAAAASTARVDDLGEVDVGVLGAGEASPRAIACRPSRRSTSRRCSVERVARASRRAARRGGRGGGAAPTASPGRSSAACAARGRRRRRSAAWRRARARGRPPSARGARASR